jgi:hypothetical protein
MVNILRFIIYILHMSQHLFLRFSDCLLELLWRFAFLHFMLDTVRSIYILHNSLQPSSTWMNIRSDFSINTRNPNRYDAVECWVWKMEKREKVITSKFQPGFKCKWTTKELRSM